MLGIVVNRDQSNCQHALVDRLMSSSHFLVTTEGVVQAFRNYAAPTFDVEYVGAAHNRTG